MASSNAIRGTRVGGGPIRLTERGEPAPRKAIAYWCANGHETAVFFAIDAAVPSVWECPRCGLPGGQDRADPPGKPRSEPYKTHLAYVKERRSEADAEALLEEALAHLRRRRGSVKEP